MFGFGVGEFDGGFAGAFGAGCGAALCGCGAGRPGGSFDGRRVKSTPREAFTSTVFCTSISFQSTVFSPPSAVR